MTQSKLGTSKWFWEVEAASLIIYHITHLVQLVYKNMAAGTILAYKHGRAREITHHTHIFPSYMFVSLMFILFVSFVYIVSVCIIYASI